MDLFFQQQPGRTFSQPRDHFLAHLYTHSYHNIPCFNFRVGAVIRRLHRAPLDVDVETAGAELPVAHGALSVLRGPHSSHRRNDMFEEEEVDGRPKSAVMRR